VEIMTGWQREIRVHQGRKSKIGARRLKEFSEQERLRSENRRRPLKNHANDVGWAMNSISRVIQYRDGIKLEVLTT
jgi:hypothetical protein